MPLLLGSLHSSQRHHLHVEEGAIGILTLSLSRHYCVDDDDPRSIGDQGGYSVQQNLATLIIRPVVKYIAEEIKISAFRNGMMSAVNSNFERASNLEADRTMFVSYLP